MYQVMIHPDFWTDDLVDMLDADGQLSYIGMWQVAERSAVFEPNFRAIQKKLFPTGRVSAAQVEGYYQILVRERKVFEYRAGGKRLAWIKAYHLRQKIENPPPPRLPLPPWVRYFDLNDPGEQKRSKFRYVVLPFDFEQDPPVAPSQAEITRFLDALKLEAQKEARRRV